MTKQMQGMVRAASSVTLMTVVITVVHHALRFRRPAPELSSPACAVGQSSSKAKATEGALPEH